MFKVCHNTFDFIGDDFDKYMNLIYIISENGKVVYCYTDDDIEGITKDLKVFEWDTKNPRMKHVMKLPNENVWIDHVSIMLLKYFRSFILKKIRYQKIGSEFGVSNIHGEEYSLYRLIPVKRQIVNKVSKEKDCFNLLQEKVSGEILFNKAPSIKKYDNCIAFGYIEYDLDDEENRILKMNGTIFTDMGHSYKYLGDLKKFHHELTTEVVMNGKDILKKENYLPYSQDDIQIISVDEVDEYESDDETINNLETIDEEDENESENDNFIFRRNIMDLPDISEETDEDNSENENRNLDDISEEDETEYED